MLLDVYVLSALAAHSTLGGDVFGLRSDAKAYTTLYVRTLQLEGVHPTVTIEDCLEAEEIVKADAGIIKLLKERYGLTPERVAFDPWYYGDRCACPFLPQKSSCGGPLLIVAWVCWQSSYHWSVAATGIECLAAPTVCLLCKHCCTHRLYPARRL